MSRGVRQVERLCTRCADCACWWALAEPLGRIATDLHKRLVRGVPMTWEVQPLVA
eukprot:CAMPEP_0119419594 /NCGR_PEP_ID=MMETSP1335-20130426/21297_1 /TAXON_ID=259385 /ORGANISM="Chrysoculter rhomboideus, Strain RCC1486" /LENGTH=54 /DNA_ID=CAMNT_0007444913 /DNA_START=123 /DNA_END=287 /DNA_ORIENTATION=+